jgi:hypothetical protein
VPIQGGTSCLGAMTEEGFHSRDAFGLGLLGIADSEGSYGAGLADAAEDPESAAIRALEEALSQAGRRGEVPAAVLVSSSPGREERIIRAIEKHVGTGVPIIGGTSADNDMSGQWRQFANGAVCDNGVSIAVIFPACDIGCSFHSGYEPTDCRGRATRAENRILHEIDGRPAARVYNEWTGGLAEPVLAAGGSLVPAATFAPLGIPVGQIRGIPYYRLSYPTAVLPDGALQLFTDIQPGSDVVLMKGTPDSLVSRTARVSTAAVETAPFNGADIEGAFVLFCCGCMLAVRERMAEPCEGLRSVLGGSPFLCSFTLGEQGCFIGGENRHGNLMVVVLVFGRKRTE